MRRYQPFYCEENVYWLVQEPELADGDPHAVFITNPARRCRFARQRLSPGVVVWDYHVIAVAHGRAWDLDSDLGAPVPLGDYLAATLRESDPTLRFRAVPAATLRETFTTDRSHMRAPDGQFRQPPPPWPAPTAPGRAMNLERFLDMRDPVAGRVLAREALLRELG